MIKLHLSTHITDEHTSRVHPGSFVNRRNDGAGWGCAMKKRLKEKRFLEKLMGVSIRSHAFRINTDKGRIGENCYESEDMQGTLSTVRGVEVSAKTSISDNNDNEGSKVSD